MAAAAIAAGAITGVITITTMVLLAFGAAASGGQVTGVEATGPVTGVAATGPGYGGYYGAPAIAYAPFVTRSVFGSKADAAGATAPPAAPPNPNPNAQQWWYWCVSAKNYYPYVASCAEGWQRVPPQPSKAPNDFYLQIYRHSAVAALAAGCVTVPTGPTYNAMPGSRKSFDQFQFDDASCRQYAVQTTGGTPNDAAANAAVGSAVVGTILGAAVGGMIGGGEGAAVGAGMGLFGGSAVGASNAQYASYTTQQRFDNSVLPVHVFARAQGADAGELRALAASGERVPRTRAVCRRSAAQCRSSRR